MKTRSLFVCSGSDSTETPCGGGSQVWVASQIVARRSMSEAGACEILSGPLRPGGFTRKSGRKRAWRPLYSFIQRPRL
jgi:hypothetical protein